MRLTYEHLEKRYNATGAPVPLAPAEVPIEDISTIMPPAQVQYVAEFSDISHGVIGNPVQHNCEFDGDIIDKPPVLNIYDATPAAIAYHIEDLIQKIHSGAYGSPNDSYGIMWSDEDYGVLNATTNQVFIFKCEPGDHPIGVQNKLSAATFGQSGWSVDVALIEELDRHSSKCTEGQRRRNAAEPIHKALLDSEVFRQSAIHEDLKKQSESYRIRTCGTPQVMANVPKLMDPLHTSGLGSEVFRQLAIYEELQKQSTRSPAARA